MIRLLRSQVQQAADFNDQVSQRCLPLWRLHRHSGYVWGPFHPAEMCIISLIQMRHCTTNFECCSATALPRKLTYVTTVATLFTALSPNKLEFTKLELT